MTSTTKYTKYDFPYTWHICVYCKQPIFKQGEHSASIVESYLSTHEGKPSVVTAYTREEQDKYKNSPKVYYHDDCYKEMTERNFLPALLKHAPDREQCKTDEEFNEWQESYKENEEKYKKYKEKKDEPTLHDKLMIRWLKFIDKGKLVPSFIEDELHHILSVIDTDTYYSVLDMLIKNSKKNLSRQNVEERITAKEPLCPTCGDGLGWQRQYFDGHKAYCVRWVQLCQMLGFQPLFIFKGSYKDLMPLESSMYNKKNTEKEKLKAATDYLEIKLKLKYWNILIEYNEHEKSVEELVRNHPLEETKQKVIKENCRDIPEYLRNKMLGISKISDDLQTVRNISSQNSLDNHPF